MADSTVTLTPNADGGKNVWTREGGAGSDYATVTDASDSTYMRGAYNNQGNYLRYDLTTHAFASTDQLRSITVTMKCFGGNKALVRVKIYNVNNPDPYLAYGTFTVTSGSPVTLSKTYPLNYTPTQDDIDNLRIKIEQPLYGATSGYASDFRIAELSVVLNYNQVPVISSVSSPSGSITTTAKPTVVWTYTDPEADAQERFQVRVFSAEQYGAPGDPDTWIPTYDSGEVFSQEQTHVITENLTDSTTYKAYVRAADVGSNGRYSAWVASSTFTIALQPPATPTLIAVGDSALARVQLTAQGRVNVLSANASSIETNASDWEAASNCAVARSTAQAADGSASLSLTSSALGNMSARLTPWSSYPIQPNTQYTAMANFRAAASARSVRVEINWYKADGSASTTPNTQGSTTTDATGNFNTQATLTATSPPDAYFALVVVTILSTGAGGEVHYVDKISFAPGSSTTWTIGGYADTHQFELQRSTDGVTWETVSRTNPTNGEVDSESLFTTTNSESQSDTLYDYEAPRGVVSHYRLRSVAGSDYGIQSAWSTPSSAGLSIPSTSSWNLKALNDPSLNLLDIDFQDPPMEINRDENAAFFSVIGRSNKVKVSDTISGDEIPLTALFTDEDDYNNFTAIRATQDVCLLQAPNGEQWYMNFDTQGTIEGLKNTNYYYRAVRIKFIEADNP